MKWLITVLTAFFGAILSWLTERARPKAEDATPDRQIRDKLRAKVRKHWLILAFLLPTLLTGCAGGAPFTRTVYVADGTPVRLRKTIRNAKVWVKDAAGEPVAGTMDLPEGWYVLPVDEGND